MIKSNAGMGAAPSMPLRCWRECGCWLDRLAHIFVEVGFAPTTYDFYGRHSDCLSSSTASTNRRQVRSIFGLSTDIR